MLNKISTLAAAVALAAATLAPMTAAAQEGPLLVRVRALRLDSANKDTTGLGLSVNNKTFPEVDFTYFFSPNLAAELILTYPQKHTLYSNGAEIGSLKHLPPVLSLQYHFDPTGSIRPYVGAGLNYTNFSDVRWTPAVVAALDPNIKRNSVGLALQAGVDFEISKGTFLNLDIKKVKLGTDVLSKGAKVGSFKVDPTLVSLGLGWRF